jgi:hypothetical protein
MISQGITKEWGHVRIVSPRPFSLFRIRDNSGQWQTPPFSRLLRHPHFLDDNSGLFKSTASPLYRHTLFAWATATPRPNLDPRALLIFDLPQVPSRGIGREGAPKPFQPSPCRELQSTFGSPAGHIYRLKNVQARKTPAGGSIQFGRAAQAVEASEPGTTETLLPAPSIPFSPLGEAGRDHTP